MPNHCNPCTLETVWVKLNYKKGWMTVQGTVSHHIEQPRSYHVSTDQGEFQRNKYIQAIPWGGCLEQDPFDGTMKADKGRLPAANSYWSQVQEPCSLTYTCAPWKTNIYNGPFPPSKSANQTLTQPNGKTVSTELSSNSLFHYNFCSVFNKGIWLKLTVLPVKHFIDCSCIILTNHIFKIL